jgi:Ca-activated chloride channel family protein
MTFLSPTWLLLLLVVAAVLVAYLVVQLRRKKYVARFSNVELLSSVAPRRPGWRRHLTFALLVIGLAVLSIGAARPAAAVRVPRERATVIMDIDVSLSMEATDILPSRIAAAKAAALKFVDLLPSRINLGLVSFGGNASLLVAPTVDRDVVKKAIGGLQLQNSTAIGEAIFTSLNAIQVFSQATTAHGENPAPARIVLLSDGANTVGRSPAAGVQAAQKAKVQISTIAFGREDATITYDGQTVPVPPDQATLQAIARDTGGSYQAAASAQGLQSVYKNIGSKIGYTTEHKDISWRFLVIGLLFTVAAAGASMLWAGRLV